jgi:hypothetical protein
MTYKELDPNYLHELFKYDSETGSLTWKTRPERHFLSRGSCITWNKRFAGKEAGTLHISKRSKTTYRMSKAFGYMVLNHILIWAMVHRKWPESTIDHADLDGLNNRLSNLREATQTDQLKNRPKRSDNTSGKTGVSWHMGSNLWQARISVDGKETCLGWYADWHEAVNVRVAAEKRYGYETGIKEGYDASSV